MNSPQHYLDYLDKEMTIMGILSTFCVVVPSLLIERAFSASKDAIGYCFLLNLLSNGLICIFIASLLFLIGAAFFINNDLSLLGITVRSRWNLQYQNILKEVLISGSRKLIRGRLGSHTIAHFGL